MPVVDYRICAEANKDLAPVDGQSMLCAGYATAGNVISGCQGDSGGPFVCEENGRFVLHGAVSWGHPRCEAESSYTVFARVSSYVDWINDKMAIGGLVLLIFEIINFSLKTKSGILWKNQSHNTEFIFHFPKDFRKQKMFPTLPTYFIRQKIQLFMFSLITNIITSMNKPFLFLRIYCH